jgi:hypothetical protein
MFASNGRATEIKGCFIGAYLGCGNNESCISEEDFNNQAGKAHAIFIKYMDTNDTGNEELMTWARKVPIPMVVYEPKESGLDNLNLTAIRTFATRMKELDKMVLIVFGHEMNGNWNYPWQQKSIQYKSSFKTVAEIFHEIAPKVEMCWVPNQNWGYPFGGKDEGDGYTEYYPDGAGSYGEYVDWVGLNFYASDYNELDLPKILEFIDNIKYGVEAAGGATINFHEVFAIGKNKPMLIAETAAFDPAPTDQIKFKNNWISQIYNETTLKQEFPNLHAICYFHVAKYETITTKKHEYPNIFADYRIPLDTGNYSQLISSSYFLSKVQSPILAPINLLLLNK